MLIIMFLSNKYKNRIEKPFQNGCYIYVTFKTQPVHYITYVLKVFRLIISTVCCYIKWSINKKLFITVTFNCYADMVSYVHINMRMLRNSWKFFIKATCRKLVRFALKNYSTVCESSTHYWYLKMFTLQKRLIFYVKQCFITKYSLEWFNLK